MSRGVAGRVPLRIALYQLTARGFCRSSRNNLLTPLVKLRIRASHLWGLVATLRNAAVSPLQDASTQAPPPKSTLGLQEPCWSARMPSARHCQKSARSAADGAPSNARSSASVSPRAPTTASSSAARSQASWRQAEAAMALGQSA